jgi:hypothetical protein
VLCTVRRVSPSTDIPAPPKEVKPYLDKGKFDKERGGK